MVTITVLAVARAALIKARCPSCSAPIVITTAVSPNRPARAASRSARLYTTLVTERLLLWPSSPSSSHGAASRSTPENVQQRLGLFGRQHPGRQRAIRGQPGHRQVRGP